ncbi:MAG: hypothetical protein HY587_05185 [Candidatus Omnitrophica bacterium]|nr:hypothetical protein [Candidatus Omnitrophota bacterium]
MKNRKHRFFKRFWFSVYFLLLSGCAASFSYVPLSSSSGNVDFVHVASRREPNAVIVQGTLGNNLGFPVYDVVVRGVGYDQSGQPVSLGATLIPGELEQGKGAPFEIAFETVPARIVQFQLEAQTTQVADAADQESGGFTKTIGIGSSAGRMAESIANASQDAARGWGAAGNVFEFANRASQTFQPAVAGKSGRDIVTVTHTSPLYHVAD